MKEKINELYKTIEAKDKIIDEQVLEIAELRKTLHNINYSDGETTTPVLDLIDINKELRQRINKAIEYIKENCSNYYVEKPNYRGVELINIEELLKILGEKENV